jgi:4'-phosphopantetheinyl transferase
MAAAAKFRPASGDLLGSRATRTNLFHTPWAQEALFIKQANIDAWTARRILRYGRRFIAGASSRSNIVKSESAVSVMDHGNPVWDLPSGSYLLPANEVHVWRATLEMSASDVAKLWQVLSPDERERADRFHFEADRRRCVIGRGLLRLLLGRISDEPARQLRFEYDKYGKPSLIAERASPLQFNLSHSGEVVLIAIAVGRAIGIDVERIRADVATDRIAENYFSENECKTLASLAAHMQCEAFFACWTRKEAYLKARGDGLSLPLDQFDVSLRPDEEPRLLETRHDPADARRWTLRALDAGRGYAAALAVEGSDWKLKCWDWSA